MSRTKSAKMYGVLFVAGLATVGIAHHAMACVSGCSGQVHEGTSAHCDPTDGGDQGWVGYNIQSDKTEYGILAGATRNTIGSAWDTSGHPLGCGIGPFHDGQTHARSCGATIGWYECCIESHC